MALIVKKFGGTSVADSDRIRRVAHRVARAKRLGDDVVVVVSAMGHSTDELIALARSVTAEPRRRHPREFAMLLTAGERISMALLAMAIRDLGVEAISLTGSQAAIITDETHTGARIAEVRATRVREELEKGCVVIVAGFQGVSRAKEVTTLGRGGSDTTAVALAAALGAERCDIYTDVDGIYTADPRKVPAARLIPTIDDHELVELAASGAQVMHPRAVEIGARYGVPIRVLSSFRTDGEPGGTVIQRRQETMEGLVLTGLASEGGYARLVLRGLPANTATVTTVLSSLAAANVSVDLVVLADRPDERRQVQLTLPEESLSEALPICESIVADMGEGVVGIQRGLSRVALVGSGMLGVPGVYARAFEALGSEGIEVHAVSTSSISITFIVDSTQETRTLQLLHDAFGLAGAAGEVAA
jgi:aspartate kinase